ncbi:glycine cleavage system protein GcvH [Sphingomonas sp. Leaf343]|uniref:glycine cleavage system protein GcvH n=1 Tax=Sphingomonas sp. Leaf343 TaxID=1736345 RepID=UPI0006FDECED|nr:glycine cleavage system protein GcvH [Sphingomonas sp. Leaf343]KQR80935.1 glycine cleavage system protein H [Sphingomonas sp. Leaf343]
MRYFTEDHEWIEVDGAIGTVGISEYAQSQLGDIVFVDVPADGRQLSKGDEAAVVESVKAASDVYSPVSGSVLEGNPAVSDSPDLVNSDAEGEGWFFRITLSDEAELDELMDEAAYEAFVAKL